MTVTATQRSSTSTGANPCGYTVRSGDSLTAIARRHGLSLQALIQANPQIRDPNRIMPGQLVAIPGGGATSSASSSPAPASDGRYTVKRGDSMAKIAQAHGISLASLKHANPQVRDPNRIYAGQQLTIPGVAANGASHADRGRSDTPATAPVVNGGLSAATLQAQIAGNTKPTLRQGASGQAVVDLQNRLKQLGHDPGPADGKFGPRTAAAVRAFQHSQRIAVDGVVGPQTWGKLASPVANPSPPPATGSVNSSGVPADLARYGNGRIPSSALTPIGVGSHRLWAPAADAFKRMRADAAAAGITIGVTDSYRSYDAQVDLARRKGLYSNGGLAAVPGTSKHGWGLAVDLDLNSRAQAWMQANAGRYGFSTIPREPWHWQYGG
ncbi:MAG: LysM peptidoglycan-binding domain-containing protein [Pseudomonadota bacterium]